MGSAIGTIISTRDEPNSNSFCFVINGDAKKGQFVSVETKEGKMIARISDIIKMNRYFERAESVQEFERSGKPLTELFPAERWEYLVGRCMALGVQKGKTLTRSAFPPSPGSKVYIADNETLSNFFGLDPEKGLFLGKMEHHELPVKLNLTRFLQKHLAILAISGAGKSYLASVLMEELLDRKEEHGNLAIVVIDTHGEYLGFSEDPKYRDRTNVVLGRDFKIGVPGMSAAVVSSIIPHMTSVQKRELNKLLAKLNEEKRGSIFDLRDALALLEDDKIIKNKPTRSILYTYLHDLDSTGLFGGYDNPSLHKLARPGHLTIIDISDMTGLREKQIVVAYMARKLFEARRAGAVPPFLLIVEEAHNFAPEGVHREGAISRPIIQKIAREGRKFHACLCLISQRPIQLNTTALSQCNTHCILRVTNPYDLDHIGKSSEGLTSDVLKSISSLRVGEALIVGEAVNFPLFLKVRERRSKKSERGKALEQACIEFSKAAKEKLKDTEAFI